MELIGSILEKLDDNTLGNLASSVGVNQNQAKSAVMAALPMLLSGLQRNAAQPAGAEALSKALDNDHNEGVLGKLGSLMGSGGSSEGQKILGHIFGNRSSKVEQGVSKLAGIDAASAGKLMSTLAPVVMGALGEAKRKSGLSAKDLGSLLEREEKAVRQQQPESSGLASMLLDADGDGDVDFSDLASKAASLAGGFFKR